MSVAADWLERRRPAAPPSLMEAMLREVERASWEPSPEVASDNAAHLLAAAGLAALEDVADGPGDRQSANRLLAADALLTYACEAAAEAGPAALADLLSALGPERFEALVEGGTAS